MARPTAEPIRTCIGCRAPQRAGALVRVGLRDATLITGPGPGRGAWIGPSPVCLDRVIQRKALPRALRAEVNAAEIARLVASWSTGPSACPHADS